MTTPTGTLTGTFTITSWDEEPYTTFSEGGKQSHAKISEAYEGDISGTSSLQYLMSYQSDGTALFTGFEVLEASMKGAEGRVILQHTGRFDGSSAKSNFTLVPGSGTGAWAGKTGTGRFEAGQGGQANYTLTLS